MAPPLDRDDLFDAIRHHEPAPLREGLPDASTDAQAVVQRAMARRPGDRYHVCCPKDGKVKSLASSSGSASRPAPLFSASRPRA